MTGAAAGVATAPVVDAALLPHIFRELDDRGIELARVTTNPVSAVAACLLLLAFALAMCWVPALIGTMVKTPQGAQTFGFIAFFPLVFGSNLLAPTATMPGWLQAFVKVNPMTMLTDAKRGLFTGGAVATPAVRSLLWALGIFVVFAPLAVRVYRHRT